MLACSRAGHLSRLSWRRRWLQPAAGTTTVSARPRPPSWPSGSLVSPTRAAGLASGLALLADVTDSGRVIPHRAHQFVRTMRGMWACINRDCDGVPAEGRDGRRVGRLLGFPTPGCPSCGSRVLELLYCYSCGDVSSAALVVDRLDEAAGEGTGAVLGAASVGQVQVDTPPVFRRDHTSYVWFWPGDRPVQADRLEQEDPWGQEGRFRLRAGAARCGAGPGDAGRGPGPRLDARRRADLAEHQRIPRCRTAARGATPRATTPGTPSSRAPSGRPSVHTRRAQPSPPSCTSRSWWEPGRQA